MIAALVGSVIGIILGAGGILIPFWISENVYQRKVKELEEQRKKYRGY